MGELVERVLVGALEIVVAFLIAPAVVWGYLQSFCRVRLWMDLGAERPDDTDLLSAWLQAISKLPDVVIDRTFPTVYIAAVPLVCPILYHVWSSEPGIQLDIAKSTAEILLSLATGVYVGSWFHNKTVEKTHDCLMNALNHACWGLLFCGLSYVPLVNIPLESWLPTVVPLAEPLAGSGFWNHFLYGLVAWAFVGVMIKFNMSLIGLVVLRDWRCSGLYCTTLVAVGYFVWGGGGAVSLYYVAAGWLLCNLPIPSEKAVP